jgi:hypothetical protein
LVYTPIATEAPAEKLHGGDEDEDEDNKKKQKRERKGLAWLLRELG